MSDPDAGDGYVFISYAREDAARVDELERVLRLAGVPTWRDTADLSPGQDWRVWIRRAITDGALVFLACFSEAALVRPVRYQNEELVLAVEQARLRPADDSWLIPVRFDECQIPDLELGGGRTLAGIHSADLFGVDELPSTGRLVEAVRRKLGLGAPARSGVRGRGRIVVGEIAQRPAAFQPRPDLVAALITGSSAGVFAVTGMRGTGKSQIAAECARQRLTQGWPVVAWVDASSRDGLLTGYAKLAGALGVGGDTPDPQVAAERIRHWLEEDGKRCLLVLDNADSADMLRPFLPAAGTAQVIITSSRASLAALGTPVTVDVFSKAESAAFLHERTRLDDQPGALAVAGELGDLPLALAQAAAVIAGQRLDYPTYLRRLATVTVTAYLTRPEEDPYPHGTAEAIILALDSATKSDLSGIRDRMLAVLALLSPAGVSRAVLAGMADDLTADEVIGHLASWSVVSFSLDGSAVLAHRLILRVLRERAAAAGALPAAARDAISLLGKALPSQDDAWRHPVLMRELISQVFALTVHLDADPDLHAEAESPESLNLLAQAGWYLNEVSDISRAIPLLERVRSDREQVLGTDHPDTLSSGHSLAEAYRTAGQLDQALALHEQILADRQRVLGPDHPDTLASLDNLAVTRRIAGRLLEAIPMLEMVLARREQILGADHADTLTTRSNLAYAYRAAGKPDQALHLFEQVLADRVRVLVPDHPHTLTSRSYLAAAYRSVGQVSQAIALHQQTLADRERILGPDHADTLISRSNLAFAYRAAGRPGEAIPIFRQVLTDRERILGPDHPSTLTCRSNLAAAYRAEGELSRAIALHQRTLADRERILGPDHPRTVTSRSDLAVAYRTTGQLNHAMPLLRQVLADRQRILGASHPDTLTARNNLAFAYRQAGDLNQAIDLHRQTLADRERVLEPGHPSITISRHNLAYACRQAGQLQEAIALFRQVAEDRQRILGPDHPKTAAARQNLADALDAQSAQELGAASGSKKG